MRLYKKIMIKYGFDAQREKWIEELLELATILQQSKNKKVDIETEIADVEICIEQMRLYYNNKIINSQKEYKLKRTEQRLFGNDKKKE